MSHVSTFRHASWTSCPSPAVLEYAALALETGDVLFLPDLPFGIEPDETFLCSPAIIAGGKNISFDPASGRLGGSSLRSDEAGRLRQMLSRFSALSQALVEQLFPFYRVHIQRGRASFRPVEIEGRATSWSKDDTRLHVDSFPATPVQDKRILRVFSNVNPHGRARLWRIGEEFESVARRFAPKLRLPLPGTGSMLRLLRVTKSRRSAYDALMLQLHDRMKEDSEYQARSPQTRVDFPAGTTWIAFTDQVSHAAMAGQYQLEQTFLLPVDAMIDDRGSPLRILERTHGRRLA